MYNSNNLDLKGSSTYLNIDLFKEVLDLGKLESEINDIEINNEVKEIEISNEVKEIIEKVIGKLLESNNLLYGIDQDSLKDISLKKYFYDLLDEHPELRGLLNFELQLGEIVSLNYEDCKPSDKIRLLALISALDRNKILPNTHINKDGSYNIDNINKRYNNEIITINRNLSALFKLSQYKNLGLIKKTLESEYGLSKEEINALKTYLDEVQKHIDSTEPKEARSGYFFVFLAGILTTVLGMMVYDKIINPNGMREIEIGEIELTGLHSIGKLVPAVAEFSSTGEVEEKLYNETTDDRWFKQNAKRIVNALQSKKIIMELKGKVGAEFDISEESGAKFIYDPTTKMMRVSLNEPFFIIRESNPKITYSNNEVFEMNKFSNTEIRLLKDLEEGAINNDYITEPLANKAGEEVAKLLYKIYGPLIQHFNHELIGVEVIISGDKSFYSQEQLNGIKIEERPN